MMTHNEMLAATAAGRPGRKTWAVAVAALDAVYGPTRFERRGAFPATEINKYRRVTDAVYIYIDRFLRSGR